MTTTLEGSIDLGCGVPSRSDATRIRCLQGRIVLPRAIRAALPPAIEFIPCVDRVKQNRRVFSQPVKPLPSGSILQTRARSSG